MTTACVILAGGEGRRMGGSKPLRRLGATTLIGQALELARRYGEPTAVAVRSAEQVGATPAPLLLDPPGIPGPLAGLAAALTFARDHGAARVLTIPCDMPKLPCDLARRLGTALDESPNALAAVASGSSQLYPVCALWKVEALDAIAGYVAGGSSSLKGFASACGSTVVRWPSDQCDPFVNANTPEELAALQSGFERGVDGGVPDWGAAGV